MVHIPTDEQKNRISFQQRFSSLVVAAETNLFTIPTALTLMLFATSPFLHLLLCSLTPLPPGHPPLPKTVQRLPPRKALCVEFLIPFDLSKLRTKLSLREIGQKLSFPLPFHPLLLPLSSNSYLSPPCFFGFSRRQGEGKTHGTQLQKFSGLTVYRNVFYTPIYMMSSHCHYEKSTLKIIRTFVEIEYFYMLMAQGQAREEGLFIYDCSGEA